MAHKENQRIALTRRLLQEGLLRLLAHEKLEQISVTALCKEAGINRATFYNHYASPAELLSEMEHYLAEELEEVVRAPSSYDDYSDRVERYCIKLKENVNLVNVLIDYHADRDLEDIMVTLAESYRRNRLNLSNTEMDNDTSHLVASYMYAGCYAIVIEWLRRGIDKTPREIADLMLSIVNKNYL